MRHIQMQAYGPAAVLQVAGTEMPQPGPLAAAIETVAHTSAWGRYEIQEHIDTCFTCLAKSLPIAQQVAVILKDIYDFSLQEIMHILGKTEGSAKYLLQEGRKTLTAVFDQRCALVSKEGACHQCSELNGWFNPKQDQQAALMRIRMAREAGQQDSRALYALRTQLVKAIDPLQGAGNELQEVLMNCNRMAMQELPLPGQPPQSS
ncbi:MAG: hypothetical protein OHK0039_41230 [Bacteroidia bacterium]